MTLLEKLTAAGRNGAIYLSTDKTLNDVRAEVKRLRQQGYQIKETVLQNDKHSIVDGKRVKFTLESGVL